LVPGCITALAPGPRDGASASAGIKPAERLLVQAMDGSLVESNPVKLSALENPGG